MNNSNSNLPISEILTGDEVIFNPLKSRVIIYLFCLIFIIGYIMDMIFIESNTLIYYVDLISILFSILIVAFFYFKRFEISMVVKLQIIFLLANIVISNYFKTFNSAEFVSAFLRNTIILFMLIPIYGLYSGKKHIFLIGLVYLVLYISTLIRADNEILSSNAPIIIFSTLIYLAGIYLIFDTIEKMHSYQIRLNHGLKRQKDQAEIQKTKIEQLNKDLQATNDKLLESNSTKDKLFSIIAHDLRSPFNNILGLSELLIENTRNYEEIHSDEYLELINISAKNTLMLVDNLLNWAKAQSGQILIHPEKLMLSKVFKEIVEQANSVAKLKDISIKYTKVDDIEILTDENLLKIIVRNLISNAIKFSESGGNVIISAKKEDNKVKISIADDGLGMSRETSEKLFDLSTSNSTTGTANEKGSGLGLVLCKEIIGLLGGKIWVESVVGVGSCFSFLLPVNN